MKAIVDEDLCIGCGACEDVCPNAFKLDEDGISHVIVEDPQPELYGCIREAEDACPVAAITVTE
jgi:ferredoxin